MNWMFELYRSLSADADLEGDIVATVARDGGRLDFREGVEEPHGKYVCLTFEFDSRDAAEKSASHLRALGHHVEEPTDYGP